MFVHSVCVLSVCGYLCVRIVLFFFDSVLVCVVLCVCVCCCLFAHVFVYWVRVSVGVHVVPFSWLFVRLVACTCAWAIVVV